MPECGRESLAVALGSAHLDQISIDIQSYGGDYVAASYRSLPANQPNTYGNTVWLWNSSVVPWGVTPKKRETVSSDQQNGIETLSDITVSATTYVLGYGTGPEQSTVCASVILDAGGSVAGGDSVNIGIQNVGTASLTIRYHVLYGYLPARYGNWVGLWKGYVSPYHCPRPLGVALVPDVTDGTVTIREIPIAVRTTYTVAYFMADPDRTSDNPRAAALLTFETAAPDAPRAHRAGRR